MYIHETGSIWDGLRWNKGLIVYYYCTYFILSDIRKNQRILILAAKFQPTQTSSLSYLNRKQIGIVAQS